MAIEPPAAWDDLEQASIPLSGITELAGVPGSELPERLESAGTSGFIQAADEPSAFLVAESEDAAVGERHLLSSFLDAIESAPGPTSSAGVNVLHRLESQTGGHLIAEQVVDDIPVLGGRFTVHAGAAGAFAVTGRPVSHAAQAPRNRPKRFPLERARREVRRMYDLPPDHPVRIERVLVPLPDGDGIWAVKASTVLTSPAFTDMRVVLAANDLTVLLAYNVASASPATALYGEGEVYPVNPFRSPQRVPVRIDAIGPEVTDRLAGRGVVVNSPGMTFLQSVERDFRVPDTDPLFDEVGAYYHLTRATRFFNATLGNLFQAVPFTPLRAIVHDPENPKNAVFVPSTGELRFGDFDGRPTARSADIVYHEFSHAITDAICRLGRAARNSQPRGLSEGYSDYFAATILDDPVLGDYLLERKEGARDASKPGLRFAPDFTGKEHANGEVWSSVLWEIREKAGSEVADVVASESLYFLSSASTFREAETGLLAADQRLFPSRTGEGRHAGVIRAAFAARAS
jgi:Zn-dependent metalloprotease